MGPLNFDDVCGTCALPYSHCPGHFGYIELPLPIYHPLLFNTMYASLKCVCTACGHFRMPPLRRQMYVEQLKLLADNALVEAAVAAEGNKNLQGVCLVCVVGCMGCVGCVRCVMCEM